MLHLNTRHNAIVDEILLRLGLTEKKEEVVHALMESVLEMYLNRPNAVLFGVRRLLKKKGLL